MSINANANKGGGRQKDLIWSQVKKRTARKMASNIIAAGKISAQPCRMKAHSEKCVKSKSF
jgi:hypothetical protein